MGVLQAGAKRQTETVLQTGAEALKGEATTLRTRTRTRALALTLTLALALTLTRLAATL
jgi:hypothetical protein